LTSKDLKNKMNIFKDNNKLTIYKKQIFVTTTTILIIVVLSYW
jgi:hypothetical protein